MFFFFFQKQEADWQTMVEQLLSVSAAIFCEVKWEDLLVIVSMQNKAPVKKTSYCFKMSNEKKPGWLDYIGDYTTHLYRDYDKPL